MNMFQKIECLMDTSFVFPIAGNFSQILRRKTTIKIKRITRKIMMPPTMILFLRIVFWVIFEAKSCLLSVVIF